MALIKDMTNEGGKKLMDVFEAFSSLTAQKASRSHKDTLEGARERKQQQLGASPLRELKRSELSRWTDAETGSAVLLMTSPGSF